MTDWPTSAAPGGALSNFEILVIVGFAALGTVVQGSVGIGFGLVAGPALVAIDPSFAPGPLLLAGQVSNLRNAFGEWPEREANALRHSLLGVPLGVGAGIVVLELVDDEMLALLVGGATATAALALLSGARIRRTPRSEFGGGAASAFGSVTAGLPGPPLVLSLQDLAPACLRATCGSIVAVITAAALLALALSGNFGGDELGLLLWTLPGVTVGLVVARWARTVLVGAWFRPAVLTIALAGGLLLVVRTLAG